jgi:superfamily I DNA and/or RNA helicase
MEKKLQAMQQAAELGEGDNERTVNERAELGRFRCVGTTLARLCTSELLTDMQFDAVIIDEASMVSLPYVLVAAAFAQERIVFAGDPMQLPPISQGTAEPHRTFLETDIYLYASGAKQPADLFAWHDRFPQVTSFFDVQYRLSDHLADVISTVFYEGRLAPSVSATTPEQQSISRIFVFDSNAMQPELEIDTEGSGFRPLNKVHLGISLNIIQRLVFQTGFRPEDIGIICPFRHTSRHYWRELRKIGLENVETGTVHTFQGREKQVILFDTVMTGEKTINGKRRHFTVRPFDEIKNGLSVPRLLNVALSRCKDRLIVLADLEHIQKAYNGRFLQKLLNALIENGHLMRQLPG